MSALVWDRDGRDWPHRAASRFVQDGGLRWHVQVMGEGPALLLLHGTGATTHSWRDIMPALAGRHTVIAPDLPGHGFTRGRVSGGPTLPRMARALRGLLEELAFEPVAIIGHSAGAAIALELARSHDTAVIGFSPALTPFPGLAARLFPAMAKMLFVNPFVPSIFARMARRPGEVERFIHRATNSCIDATGLRCYTTLIGNSDHCAGALAMMAHWDLETLSRQLPSVGSPVLLAHGTNDNAVPFSSAQQACARLPDAKLVPLEGLGHLAHEEQPERAADLILQFLADRATLPTAAKGGQR